LLRSFLDDEDGSSAFAKGLPGLEKQIARNVKPYAPFVAIGEPAHLSPGGAAREFFRDETWREAVREWIRDAAFIIAIPSWTKGLQWEFSACQEQSAVGKLIVVFPPGDPHRQIRWEWLRASFANTPWSEALGAINVAKAQAVRFRADGSIVQFSSQHVGTRDLDPALQLAIFDILRH
jgi:hypothetical protein